jgi:hypothetical protein
MSHNDTDWEGIWKNGVAPGDRFDISAPHKALIAWLHKLPAGRALVPGCGRGYDLQAFATKDRHATGLDVSETGVAAAKEYLNSAIPAELAEQYTILAADAFAHEGQVSYEFVQRRHT